MSRSRGQRAGLRRWIAVGLAVAAIGGGAVARCTIGRGRATVIADADFLRAENPDSDNLQFLLAELDRIEQR